MKLFLKQTGFFLVLILALVASRHGVAGQDEDGGEVVEEAPPDEAPVEEAPTEEEATPAEGKETNSAGHLSWIAPPSSLAVLDGGKRV